MGVTGDTLFPIVWETVHVVESTGLKAIGITADGGSPNRKFFQMHKSEGKIVYKTKNIYSNDNRNIYFISDPPHLIKIPRNCWSHSHGYSSSRAMLVGSACYADTVIIDHLSSQSEQWSMHLMGPFKRAV